MPRPQRSRRVCQKPRYCSFGPPGGEGRESVRLTVDEFEVIRLVWFEKKTHEQCAKQMNISRTTVSEIYENAKYKVADAIVNGKRFVISGGKYHLCDGTGKCCGTSCRKCGKECSNEKGCTVAGAEVD